MQKYGNTEMQQKGASLLIRRDALFVDFGT